MHLPEDKLVPKLAALARLELGQGEAERLERDLQSILHHVQRLQSLPLDDVPATYWTAQSGESMRPDVPGKSLPVDDALAAAPARADRYLVVPGIREDS